MRKLVLVLGFFLVFGFVADDCFAQATSREHRIIGTWALEIYEDESDNSIVITFNQNGTMTFIESGERIPGRWAIAEHHIVLTLIEGRYEESIWGEVYISGDGRIMVLILEEERMLFRKR